MNISQKFVSYKDYFQYLRLTSCFSICDFFVLTIILHLFIQQIIDMSLTSKQCIYKDRK
jgi:hypothetical protein